MNRALEFTAVRILKRSVSADRISSLAKFMFLQELLPKLAIDHVIDVGANVGQFAESIRYMRFRGPITSFEPVPEAFEALKTRMQSDEGWTGHNLAIGDSDAVADINVMSSSLFSSFNHPVDDRDGANRVVRTCSVKVR